MQAETASSMSPWVSVVLTIIGIILTVAVPTVGWAFKQVYNRLDSTHRRIDEVKDDMKTLIGEVKTDAENKRIETRDTILDLVNEKFDSIKETLKDIKDEVKGHIRTDGK